MQKGYKEKFKAILPVSRAKKQQQWWWKLILQINAAIGQSVFQLYKEFSKKNIQLLKENLFSHNLSVCLYELVGYAA